MSDENPIPPVPGPPAGAEPVPPAGAAPVPPAPEPVPPSDVAPVPPVGAEPVPPAHQPIPPAGAAPVPPAQQPIPPAGATPVPPAQQPIPPAGATPVPPAQGPVPPADPNQFAPQQPGFETIQPQAPQQQPGFETIQPQAPQQPGFETIQPQAPQQPGFDPIPQQPASQPGYETIQITPGDPNAPSINPPPSIPPINQAVAGAATGAGAAPAAKQKPGGRRKPGKKKKTKRASKKAVSRAGARPGAYRKSVTPVDSGISFISVLLALLGALMLTISVFALLPTSLVHIDGYPTDDMSNKEPKNLLSVGQKILETRTEDATFTEEEVNNYLNYRLQGSQDGALGGFMKVKGVYVDFRPNEAEIYVERSIPLLGTTTISSVVKSHFNEIKHQQFWKVGGGSIGRIKLKDRSLQPILNVFLRMARTGAEELEVMNYMADVKIGENKITLDSSL